jgi:hypothetical protein
MNSYLIRVHYDAEVMGNFDVVEVTAPSFMVAINKALRKLSPIQKQYMHSMEAFIRCTSTQPE